MLKFTLIALASLFRSRRQLTLENIAYAISLRFFSTTPRDLPISDEGQDFA